MLEALPYTLSLGALAGLLSGLFGIGGGVIIVPLLATLFPALGFAETWVMTQAVATSLACIVLTSFFAVRAHARLGTLRWDWVKRLAPGVVAGTLLGALVGTNLPAPALKLAYALFLLFIATRMMLRTPRAPALPGSPHETIGRTALVSLGIGGISAVFGIGGGTLTVPYLHRQGLAMRNAVAVSSALGLPIALSGASMYVVLGWADPDLPPHSLGFVHLPTLFGMAVSSALTAPWGAHLAHRLPTDILRRLFVLLLALVALHFAGQGLGLLQG